MKCDALKIIVIFILMSTMSSLHLMGQIYDPVKWTTDCKHLEGDQYELTFSATIDQGWHIYSMNIGDEGPIRTSINFETSINAVSPISESSSQRIDGFDAVFEMDLIKLKKDATYTQIIETTDPSKEISGYITYMVCDKTKCLPPNDEDFSIIPVEYIDASANGAKEVSETKKKSGNIPTTKSQQVDDSSLNKPTSDTKTSTSKYKKSSGIDEPVTWSGKIKKNDEGQISITFEADIADGWNIYSKDLVGDGPIPTGVVLGEGVGVKQIGELEEKAKIITKEYDKNFEMELAKLKKGATYTIVVQPNRDNDLLGGYLEYMACTSSKCIFPDPVEFLVNPKKSTIKLGPDVYTNFSEGSTISHVVGLPFASLDEEKLANPSGACATENRAAIKKKGIWNILLLGFFGGLIALLTPCVFPMIPLTVSFFTKGSENRKKGMTNAFLYGFFILAVYLLLSVPFHLMDSLNPDILNNISTNVWLNLLFFAIFLFFAFSFFGYYELTLPSSWTNKTSSAESVGGLLGIFFMALTLALVSFSCTGPILGSLLAGALTSDGGAMQLTAGMGGFGLALALPFGLFAAFPSIMTKLPHSGGWLNTVKVVLGFLELALAFKFLSNADLVKHWGLLKLEPFLAIWILVFLGLALYLFGIIKFPHDSPIKKLGIPRLGFGVLSLLFMFYLLTGFRYNDDTKSFSPLTLLSGLAPPVGYSWIYPNECPQDFNCFKDFDDGLAYAKKENKPILLDFTGHACVNCRKMEEHVWPKSSVKKYISDDYVLISLYVDDKTALPLDKQVVVERATGGTRKLRTIGDKWQHFQTKYFKNNSQPYYVLLSPDGDLLNNPVPYTPDDGEYAAFLECGLQNFNNLQ